MFNKIKKIKGKEYLIECRYNPKTGKKEEKSLGNINNIPKIVSDIDDDQDNLPIDFFKLYPEVMRSIESIGIETFLKLFLESVTSVYLDHYQEAIFKEKSKSCEDKKHQFFLRKNVIDEFNHLSDQMFLPGYFDGVFREMVELKSVKDKIKSKSKILLNPSIETHVTK